jgi:hypothetical protein
VAGVLLALSPVHIWYSQEARAYALIMLLAALLVLQWHRLDEGASRRVRAFWFVMTSIAISQLHYFAIAIPAALAVVALMQRRSRGVSLLALGWRGNRGAAGRQVGRQRADLRRLSPHSTQTPPRFAQVVPLGSSVALTPEETPIAQLPVEFLRDRTQFSCVACGGWRFLRRNGGSNTMLIAAVRVLLVLAIIGRENYYIERSALPSLPFSSSPSRQGLADQE